MNSFSLFGEAYLKALSAAKSLLENRKVRSALIFAAAIAFIAFSIKCIHRSINITDSYVFYMAGKAILEGRDMYDPGTLRPFMNPPFMAVFMIPFSLLDIVGFSVVWYLLNIGLLAGSLLLSVYLIRGRLPGVPAAMLLIPMVMVFRPIESNMSLGQCNLIVVFFTLLGLALFKKGFPLIGGITLAVGVSIKLTPGLFLLYFLYKKQWRMAAGITAGILFFSAGVPVLVFGYESALVVLERWLYVMRTDSLMVGSAAWDYYVPGQTIRTLLIRLLTPSKMSTRADSIYINIASLDFNTVILLANCISGLMLGALAWNFRGSHDSKSRLVSAAEMALVMLTMTIISPFSRKAHYVSMIFPSVLVVHYMLERGKSIGAEALAKRIVLATVILVVGSSQAIVGRTASIYLNGFGIIFMTAMLMWFGINFLLLKERALVLSEEQIPETGEPLVRKPMINPFDDVAEDKE